MKTETVWKEGAVVSVALGDDGPRAMRVARMQRIGPNTTEVRLEVVGGPSELVCTCPYVTDGVELAGIGTSRTCEMHGENKSGMHAKLDRIRERLGAR